MPPAVRMDEILVVVAAPQKYPQAIRRRGTGGRAVECGGLENLSCPFFPDPRSPQIRSYTREMFGKSFDNSDFDENTPKRPEIPKRGPPKAHSQTIAVHGVPLVSLCHGQQHKIPVIAVCCRPRHPPAVRGPASLPSYVAACQPRSCSGWYLLETDLPAREAFPQGVHTHYKGHAEVDAAFSEPKSYLEVRPVYHWRPDRGQNT